MDAIELHKMQPLTNLSNSPEFYVAGTTNSRYLMYKQSGGAIDVDLNDVTSSWSAYWLNPRNGELSPAAVSVSAGNVSAQTPDSQDWALILSKSAL